MDRGGTGFFGVLGEIRVSRARHARGGDPIVHLQLVCVEDEEFLAIIVELLISYSARIEKISEGNKRRRFFVRINAIIAEIKVPMDTWSGE